MTQFHDTHASGYRSAIEQPERCLADRGSCWLPAVGLVVFNSSALPAGLPVHIPLPVCEKHYKGLDTFKAQPGQTMIRTLERYHE